MKVVAVIPARYDSRRLPGKPLVSICGKTLVQRVYESTLKWEVLQRVIVATDDERIRENVKGFGGEAWMTSRRHRSGSERVAEVAHDLDADVILNVQGDEPLLRPEMFEVLVEALRNDSEAAASTLRFPLDDNKDKDNPDVVKVVVDSSDRALYFSRYPIPYCRIPDYIKVHKHLGIYAFRRDFLIKYAAMDPTPLERTEGLEQLRILESGFAINAPLSPFDSLGVDTMEDVRRLEEIFRKGEVGSWDGSDC